MLNNNGVFKTQQGMAQVDRNAYVTATIGLTGQQILGASEWISESLLKFEAGKVWCP